MRFTAEFRPGRSRHFGSVATVRQLPPVHESIPWIYRAETDILPNMSPYPRTEKVMKSQTIGRSSDFPLQGHSMPKKRVSPGLVSLECQLRELRNLGHLPRELFCDQKLRFGWSLLCFACGKFRVLYKMIIIVDVEDYGAVVGLRKCFHFASFNRQKIEKLKKFED